MTTRILKSQDIISVIISAYNADKTIRLTLESLQNQALDKKLYEVIIMDDGSSNDLTKNIVKEFIDQGSMNILYFYQKNTGVGKARNAGITQSVGKILAFTDADCICDPDWLSVIYDQIFIQKKQFIGGYTYSDDVVIFPWKMAPVLQTGITANLAIDFTLVDEILFDSGFTGMLGDDTNFVIRMEDKGINMIIIPEMKVLHPPNVLTLSRLLIRARGRHNEVGLYKKHGKRVLSSFSYIFRPIIFSRISLFSVLIVSILGFLGLIYSAFGFIGCMLVVIMGILAFHLFLYRFLVIFNPDNRRISLADRWRTLAALLIVTPLFFYYRIIGMIKFRYFML